MAKKFNVELTDDINPDLTADTTITFTIDGTHYEIDLNHKNVDQFHKTLQPWVNAARKTTTRTRRSINSAKPTGSGKTKEELQAIREWANTRNIPVPSRGRIAKAVIDQYENRAAETSTTKVAAALSKAKAKIAAVENVTFSEAK